MRIANKNFNKIILGLSNQTAKMFNSTWKGCLHILFRLHGYREGLIGTCINENLVHTCEYKELYTRADTGGHSPPPERFRGGQIFLKFDIFKIYFSKQKGMV